MFNLATDQWIQVMYLDGSLKNISLRDMFRDMHNIAGFSGASVEKIALTRLCLCISQAALNGPKTELEWEQCQSKIQSKSIKYLKQWEKRFNLYGDMSFLQIPWIKDCNENKHLKNHNIDYLMFDKSVGDNHILFDHGARSQNREFTNQEIAMGLITTQLFSLCGLVQIPEFTWLSNKIPHLTSSKASSCINVLLVIILGENLLETIRNNIIPISWLKKAKIKFGHPVWEYDAFEKLNKQGEYSDQAEEMSRSYLGNLIPLNKGLVLNESDKSLIYVDGIHNIENSSTRDPMAPLHNFEKKTSDDFRKYIPASRNQANWRDLEGILATPSGNNRSKDMIWAFRHFISKSCDHGNITSYVGGFSVKKKKKLNILEWNYFIPKNMIGEGSLNNFTNYIKNAESRLNMIIKSIYVCLNNGNNSKKLRSKMRKEATSAYWIKLERNINHVIGFINEDKYSSDLKKELDKAALYAYDIACSGIDIESKIIGRLDLKKRISKI